MRLRAPRDEDAEAIHALIVARDVADIGRADFTLDDLLADWQGPTFERARDAFVAEDESGALHGYAGIDHRGSMIVVPPESEGRGVGTLLRAAIERRADERGQARRQFIVAANAGAVAHLSAAGYERAHIYVRLRIDDLAAAPPAPAGVVVRPLDVELDARAAYAVIEGSLAEIPGNIDEDYDTWIAHVRRKVDPAFALAIDDDHGLAGGLLGERWEDGVGYVAALGVAPRARGRGYGRALLLGAFDAFRRAGLRAAELSVHGANAPATRLYESVGMCEDFRNEVWIQR